MANKKPEVIPVQYIPVQNYYEEEDEIDLRELFKTIWNYRKFIVIFTFLVTALAFLYVSLKTSIYEIKSNIQVGHINKLSKDTYVKKYFIEPFSLTVYIKNVYDNSKSTISYPQVEASIVKGTNDLILIKIDAFSNKEAIEYLNKILKDITSKENKQIKEFEKIINEKITILQQNKNNLIKDKEKYLSKIKTMNDYQIISALLQSIADIEKEIRTINEKIVDLKAQLSPINIIQTQIIGKIEKLDTPIKPKKKLIIIVAFITGFILSIFLVFFIEFLKGLREKDLQKN